MLKRLLILTLVPLFLTGCAHIQKGPKLANTPPSRISGQSPAHFTKKITKTYQLDYQIYLPDNYIHSQEKFPLIIFLHGSGERGTDVNLVKKHGVPKFVEGKNDFPFIAVSPQCPLKQYWDTEVLNALLTRIESKYRVDRDRIYLTGLSMGGYGTWNWACEYPERFAAIAPVCGGGDPDMADKLKDVPVWVFHGAQDTVVLPKESEKMVEAVKAAGGDVKFTLFPDLDHYCWEDIYNGTELYDWFLSHRRK